MSEQNCNFSITTNTFNFADFAFNGCDGKYLYNKPESPSVIASHDSQIFPSEQNGLLSDQELSNRQHTPKVLESSYVVTTPSSSITTSFVRTEKSGEFLEKSYQYVLSAGQGDEQASELQVTELQPTSTTQLTELSVACFQEYEKHENPDVSKTKNNVQKEKREKVLTNLIIGQEYLNQAAGQKEVNKKTVKREIFPRCSSKTCETSNYLKCKTITETQREELFNTFWDNMNWEERKVMVAGLVEKRSVVRRTNKSETNSRRNKTIKYFIKIANVKLPVCKRMFLNTFGLGESAVYNWIDKFDECESSLTQAKNLERENQEKDLLQTLSNIKTDNLYVESTATTEATENREKLIEKRDPPDLPYTNSQLTSINVKEPSGICKKENSDNGTPKRSKKKQGKIVNGQRNANKDARQKGQEYYSAKHESGRIIGKEKREKRILAPRCNSKRCEESNYFKCNEITEAEREELFNSFWENMTWEGRKVMVAVLVDKCSIGRRTKKTKNDSRRHKTLKYFMKLRSGKVPVCKRMFLNTFGLGQSAVRNWINKSNDYGVPLQLAKRQNLSTTNGQKIEEDNDKEFMDME